MREDKNSALITFDVEKAFDPVWVDDMSKKWTTNIWLFNRKDTRTEEICLQVHQRHDQQPHWRYEHRWSTYLHWWICSTVSNRGIRWVESFTTMPKSCQSGQLQKNTIADNILAELHSIHHALRTVFTHFKNNTIKEIIVLTDCQTTIKMTNNTLTFNTNTNQSNWFITSEIISDKISEICWYQGQMWLDTGHANDKLNNLADSLVKIAVHYSTLSVSTDCTQRTLRLDTTPVEFKQHNSIYSQKFKRKLQKKLEQNKQNSQQPIKLQHCWQSTIENEINQFTTNKPETSSLNKTNCCECQQMDEWEKKEQVNHLSFESYWACEHHHSQARITFQ